MVRGCASSRRSPIRRRCGRPLAACLRVQPLPGRSARRVGARLSRREAAVVGARQLRASPRCGRASGRRDRASLPSTCRCWRRAGRASGWRASGSSRCRRWASRPAMRTSTSSGRRRRCVCSVDRASAAKHDFALTDRNVGAVGVLCRRLDGIPLAIELAAARVRSLSPEDLVARLDQRFKLLTRGSRAALERHQTLRSTIDWSYDLLDPDRTSRVATGCRCSRVAVISRPRRRSCAGDDLDAVDVVDVLGQLVDKSLVVADDATTAGCGTGCSRRSASTPRERLQTRVATRRWCDAATPTTTSRWPKRPVRTCGAETTSSGPASSRATPTTSALRSTGRSRHRRPSTRCAWWPRLAVQGRIGELAMDWAATAIAIPGGDGHPLFPVVAAWAAWGATMGRRFRAGRRPRRRRGTSPSSARYSASVRGAGSGDPRVLSQ